LHCGIREPGIACIEQSRGFGGNLGGVVVGVGVVGGDAPRGRTLHTVPTSGKSLQTLGRSDGPHAGIVEPIAPPGEQLFSVGSPGAAGIGSNAFSEGVGDGVGVGVGEGATNPNKPGAVGLGDGVGVNP
jgi:hypothetical protein